MIQLSHTSPDLAIIQNLGGWEIGLIVLLALLLFGGRKLPELARGAGQAIREFRKATDDAEKTFKEAVKEPESTQQSARTTSPAAPTEVSKQHTTSPSQPTGS